MEWNLGIHHPFISYDYHILILLFYVLLFCVKRIELAIQYSNIYIYKYDINKSVVDMIALISMLS